MNNITAGLSISHFFLSSQFIFLSLLEADSIIQRSMRSHNKLLSHEPTRAFSKRKKAAKMDLSDFIPAAAISPGPKDPSARKEEVPFSRCRRKHHS
jgi:hypothetical protein